eukprot:s1930_g5.t6
MHHASAAIPLRCSCRHVTFRWLFTATPTTSTCGCQIGITWTPALIATLGICRGTGAGSGSSPKHLHHFPSGWSWERLRVVDAGYGQVALHSASSNRFVKMSGHDMIRSPHRNWHQLPWNWDSERFTVVDAHGHGRVALHNPWKNRFIKMCNHGDGCLSPHRERRDLCRVFQQWVKKGFGLFPQLLRSAGFGSWQLPEATWFGMPAKGAERLERAGEKETDCGTLREFFHVLEIKPCHTGGGGHCSHCQDPWHRHVNNHCRACNHGYYLHGHHCHPWTCTGCHHRVCGTCVAQQHRRHHNHCGSCNAGHFLLGSRCQSLLLGATLSFHQPNHNRFVQMWGSDMVWTGDAKIRLLNPRFNKLMRLRNNHDMDGSPHWGSWETFTAVDAGAGKVALHCAAHNKYMRMPHRHHMDAEMQIQPLCAEILLGVSRKDLPWNWGWERFKPDLPWNWGWERFKPVSAFLRHGTIVALWNAGHHRFMRMNAHNGRMDGSPRKHLHHFPSGWSWERLRVRDAGYGQVALHSASSNRFVKMSGHDMIRSPHRNWHDEVPGGWHSERFTVVDAHGHGRVALHNSWKNRFIKMCNHGDGCLSPHRDRRDASRGLSKTKEFFHVLEIKPCHTGGGGHCKTCQNPWHRHVDNHCATCNPGYYRHGHGCKAYSCTGGVHRICHACVAQHQRRQNDHCGVCDGGHVLRGTRCQSLMLGATVAFHNRHHHGRFVAMWAHDMVWTGVRGYDSLPKDWTYSFFRVHFAGDAKIGLHNPRENRWIRLRNNHDMDGAPHRGSWETFTAVDAGGWEVALHCAAHNKYMRMPNKREMDTSSHRNPWDLPGGWGWERFRPVSALLRHGTIVALWNEVHHRFMRMNAHNGHMDGSASKHLHHFPAHGWTWEPFRVVDAGFGQVALHNAQNNRFIKMAHDMIRSPTRNWNQLPGGWGSERFTIVDAGHSHGAQKVALHNSHYNRFVSMCHHGDGCVSPGKAPDHLPGGWTWQQFHVLEIKPCTTGGGGHCKTCQNPWHRHVNHHCASCNPGYYRHGHGCKAYSCTTGRTRLCGSCVAQHHRTQNDHCASCNGGHVLRGKRCQSRLLGATVALHNPHHNRFVEMKHANLVRTGGKRADQLPGSWSSTFFRVYFKSDAKIGLHNPKDNKWIRLRDNSDMDGAPHFGSWETFTAVDVGSGQVALHCAAHNKYMRMPDRHALDTSSHRNAWDLPSGWVWEKFRPVAALLRPGTTVALWNDVHKRYLRMNGHHDKMDGSSKLAKMADMPANWDWELFRVVDAGYGQVALHNHVSNRFMKMGGHDMIRSPQKNWDQLPVGWTSEKFTVVDAGGGKVALHHAEHNRFVSMCNHGDGCISPHKAPDHLPGGWTWQQYHVLEIKPCTTGGGGHCKTCQGPAHRQVNHHCATCNAGYYMHGHHCKAYSCTTGRARLCGSCVAQHQRTQNDHCASCDGGHVLRGKRCQSRLLGATVAFHNPTNNRFVEMAHSNVVRTSARKADQLPSNWQSTFFRVQFKSDGKIGLYNAKDSKWIRLRDNNDMDGAPHFGSWETFTAVDAGSGQVALHCAAHNKYMRMPDCHALDTSPHRNAWDLPSGWGWERFRPVAALLRPGTTVVDAGYGQVALHNHASNRFMKMGDHEPSACGGKGIRMSSQDMIRSPTKNWNELPSNWGAEKFTVVDAGGGKVALHHAEHNRFVSMCTDGDGCISPHKAPDHLPGGWTWQQYHVLEIKPCTTGGGGHCKTCQGPAHRQVNHHCATCNAGYYMHGHHCKAYSCTTGRARLCGSCVAQHQRTVALHCAAHNKYMRMPDRHALDTSSHRNAWDRAGKG